MSEYNPNDLPEFLPFYYKKIFPANLFYKWLDYGDDLFKRREFSFTIKDDVYIRYLSFDDKEDFEKNLIRLNPYKIDIGALYSHRPKDQKLVKGDQFRPEERELVFDIDMTDYDEVRFCCSGADICKKCWPLMGFAVQIIERALKEDFGFKHVMWVYSGRRGIHCWVADEKARKLSHSVRSAIVDYLTVVKGGAEKIKKVDLNQDSMHLIIEESIKLISENFNDYALRDQDFLGNEVKLRKVLALLPDDLNKEILTFIGKQDSGKLTSENQWKAIKTLISLKQKSVQEASLEKKPPKDIRDQMKKVQFMEEEIILQYTYPRLDAHVSTGLNHLLKSPFCIHPKTGRICVPFNPLKVFQFDPLKVPNICDVIEEYNKTENDKLTEKKDFVCPSLKESMAIFKGFIDGMEKERLKKKKELADSSLDF